MAVDINIESQIVVKTAAQWAADATVYSGQRLLVTSDATYTGTDQRKFKIANGVDTWSNLDYFPVNTGTVDGTGSANTLPYWVDADTLGFLSTTTYPSLTELSYVKGVTSSIQTQLNGKQATLTNPVTGTGVTNEIAYFTGTSTVGSLATATYPSLTEVSYVKGVTSAIQTQLNNKQALDSDLTAIAALSPSNDDIIQRKAGAWTNRTMAQLGADLTANTLIGYQGYTLQAGLSSASPADATTYYFGRTLGATLNTVDGDKSLSVIKNGTIKGIRVTVSPGTTVGSSETSTISLRLNSTTDTTITSSFQTNLNATYGSLALNIPVTSTDFFEIKWVTPTWATNPVNLVLNAIIYIE